jgi:hypothetical protein
LWFVVVVGGGGRWSVVSFVYLSHLKQPCMDYSKIETWVLLLFIFFFGVLLIRYILSVDKLLKNQERTHEMLKMIAEKIGIDKATIENIDKD